MRNYTSAFLGNHSLTLQNSDEIFRNRIAILSNMDVEGDVEINFRESMTNQANIDFLELQAKDNQLVLEVNNKMTEVNELLISINKLIMASNEKNVRFNSENLGTNKRFVEGEYHPSKATIKDNSERANENNKRIKNIKGLADKNKINLQKIHAITKKNAVEILKNSSDISQRREKISENQKNIINNQKEVAEMITKKNRS
tara:strand:- start:393 stop:995 length:603 start_codon:yes stop_codon:yes gene_type:complete